MTAKTLREARLFAIDAHKGQTYGGGKVPFEYHLASAAGVLLPPDPVLAAL